MYSICNRRRIDLLTDSQVAINH